MSTKDLADAVFKALADSIRRRVLDQLRNQPRTTGELCKNFPELTRFGVMKHLDVLEQAGLVIVRREGRERWNSLNVVPIQQIYERWMSRFAAPHAASLLKLARKLEEKK